MRVLCVLLSILLSPLTQADSLVIQRVTVIDATGKPAQSDMTIVIEKIGSQRSARGRRSRLLQAHRSSTAEGSF